MSGACTRVWRVCAPARATSIKTVLLHACACCGSVTYVSWDATGRKEVGNGRRVGSLQLDAPEEAGKKMDSEQHNREESPDLEQGGPNNYDGIVLYSPESVTIECHGTAQEK